MPTLFLLSPLQMHLLLLPPPALRFHSVSFLHLAQLSNTLCPIGIKT